MSAPKWLLEQGQSKEALGRLGALGLPGNMRPVYPHLTERAGPDDGEGLSALLDLQASLPIPAASLQGPARNLAYHSFVLLFQDTEIKLCRGLLAPPCEVLR